MSTSTGRSPVPLGYQPALDGLRAVAVVAVLLYHENIGRNATTGVLPGGFLGVDVFFVLSGFLITGILLADHTRTGHVVSGEFWIRRARRLLPASFLLLLLVSAYAILAAPAYSLGDLRRESIAALFYVSNWVAIAVPSPQITPLSHLWSLSVEEQWYVVWPLLLVGVLAVARGRRRHLLVGVLALALASYVWMIVLYSPAEAQRVAAGTDTRAWELLLGAALAVIVAGRPPRLSTAGSTVVEVGGFVALGFLAWAFATVGVADEWLNRGGIGLVALATVALLVAAIDPGSRVFRRLLGWRPLVVIGLVSYGLYLFHLLVYIWLSEDEVGLSGPALLAVRLGALTLLAAASYVLIEMPVRRNRVPSLRHAVVLAGVGVVMVAVILGATVGAEPVPDSVLALDRYRALRDTTPPGLRRVLVVGDDTAFALGWKVRPPVDVDGIRGTAAATIGCGIVDGNAVVAGQTRPRPPCRPWEDVYREAIDAFDPAVTVLTVGNAEVFDRRVGTRVLRPGTPEYAAHLSDRLEAAGEILTAGGRELLITTVPCADPQSPPYETEWAAVRRDATRADAVNAVIERFAARHPRSVRVVDLDALLCVAGRPRAAAGTEAMRPDGLTLSATGASAVWRWLAPQAATSGIRTPISPAAAAP